MCQYLNVNIVYFYLTLVVLYKEQHLACENVAQNLKWNTA